jgi:hypothetical protein
MVPREERDADMKCFWCGGVTVGQCIECSRFYCRRHGNVYCQAHLEERAKYKANRIGVWVFMGVLGFLVWPVPAMVSTVIDRLPAVLDSPMALSTLALILYFIALVTVPALAGLLARHRMLRRENRSLELLCCALDPPLSSENQQPIRPPVA